MNSILVSGVVIEKDASIVIVKEAKESCYGKWNIPAGRLNQGEDFISAAIREVKEESNLDIVLDGIVGIYTEIGDVNIIKVIFKGTALNNKITRSEEEILDVKWIKIDDFLKMSKDKLRSYDLHKIISDFREKELYDLEILK